MRHEEASRSPNSDTQPRYTGQERRRSPRIQLPFPALVRSIEANDQPFEEHAVLDNLSSCGMYLRLGCRVQQGVGLVVRIRFSISPDTNAPVAWIEVQGMVLRTEPHPDGVYGIAIELTHYRFIYTTAQPIACCAARWPHPDVPNR
jgi:PilZ domain